MSGMRRERSEKISRARTGRLVHRCQVPDVPCFSLTRAVESSWMGSTGRGSLPVSVRNFSAIGVDVGGTFTDVIALDRDGKIRTAKVPTNLKTSEAPVLEG